MESMVVRMCSTAMKQRKIRTGRIVANPSKQARNNSYSPPTFYEDCRFNCIDCGATELWTAEQQRVYFEEWKKSIYHRPVRCGVCRNQRKVQILENNQKTLEGLKQKTPQNPPSNQATKVEHGNDL